MGWKHDPNPKNIAKVKKILWLKTRGCEVTLHLATYMLQVAETIGAWDAGQHTHILLNLSHPVEPPRNTNFLTTALGISEIPTVSPGFSQILWRIWSTGTKHMKKKSTELWFPNCANCHRLNRPRYVQHTGNVLIRVVSLHFPPTAKLLPFLISSSSLH